MECAYYSADLEQRCFANGASPSRQLSEVQARVGQDQKGCHVSNGGQLRFEETKLLGFAQIFIARVLI